MAMPYGQKAEHSQREVELEDPRRVANDDADMQRMGKVQEFQVCLIPVVLFIEVM